MERRELLSVSFICKQWVNSRCTHVCIRLEHIHVCIRIEYTHMRVYEYNIYMRVYTSRIYTRVCIRIKYTNTYVVCICVCRIPGVRLVTCVHPISVNDNNYSNRRFHNRPKERGREIDGGSEKGRARTRKNVEERERGGEGRVASKRGIVRHCLLTLALSRS